MHEPRPWVSAPWGQGLSSGKGFLAGEGRGAGGAQPHGHGADEPGKATFYLRGLLPGERPPRRRLGEGPLG